MMQLDMSVTPLANGMAMWGYDLGDAASKYAIIAPKPKLTVAKPLSPSPLNTTVLSQSFVGPVLGSNAVCGNRHAKKDPAAGYRSIDPRTGRVWGAPNAGGRGQCFDCPNRAMPTNRRCESCLRKLTEAVHEQMSSQDLDELQCSFDAVLARISGSRGMRDDTAERLQQLYSKLQAGEIPSPLQAQLLVIARSLSRSDDATAGRLVAKLSTEHWELHKDWLVSVKRLLSALPM